MTTLLKKVAEFPETPAKELAKKLKTTIQSIYQARAVNKKQRQQKDRPRKMKVQNTLLEDIRIIKKIGIERVKIICELLE